MAAAGPVCPNQKPDMEEEALRAAAAAAAATTREGNPEKLRGVQGMNPPPPCWRLPPPQIPFHHSLLSQKLPNADSICSFSVTDPNVTAGSRPKCLVCPKPFNVQSLLWSPLPPPEVFLPFLLLLPPSSVSFINFRVSLLPCSSLTFHLHS